MTVEPSIVITNPVGLEQVDAVRELFSEYSTSIGIDLCFQNFDEELRTLPGAYAPPSGSLFLASVDGESIGCVAIRKLEDKTCELKRLYVRPAARGLGIGRRLTQAAVTKARELGYSRVRLDTLVSMKEARSLYESLGFRNIVPYYQNPLEGAVFMQLELTSKNAVAESVPR
jgi:ribosomal protein S18 acetylase RimI-like enzyme